MYALMRTLHEPVAILHCQGCFRGMDENHVVVDDLEFHDTNGGQHALWNISPPNSRWVSCSFDEVHADVEIGVDEWTDGALVVENTIYFVHQLYCVSGKYASSLLRNLFITNGIGEVLRINHDHHIHCINLSKSLPESPAEIAMPYVLEYMYNRGFDSTKSGDVIPLEVLASTLVSAYILRMPGLFELAKRQLSNITASDKYGVADISKIEVDLARLEETVSTKRLKHVMTLLCKNKLREKGQFTRLKHGTALKTANSHANVRRRATVSLDAGKSKDLLKENTRKYFSEKYQSYYFVNHLTGETYWDSEKNTKPRETNGQNKKQKKSRHYSVVHQKYYIHDAETNETRWATEEDLVDVAHDEENVRTTSSFRNHEKMIVETQLQKKNENGEDVQKSDKQLERPKSKRRWTKHYSAEYQQFYLHDEETNESIWDEHSASEEEHP